MFAKIWAELITSYEYLYHNNKIYYKALDSGKNPTWTLNKLFLKNLC